MVQWYHLIMTAYGFWLPNDPRGSWSDLVGSWELYKFGPATTVTGKRSYAHDPHDVALRRAAKWALKYPVVRFDDAQRGAIAKGFAQAIAESGYAVHACCLGHDHAHLVTTRHERTIERQNTVPTPWAEGIWSVFINDMEQLRAAIGYVERHPRKEGLALQHYDFVGALIV